MANYLFIYHGGKEPESQEAYDAVIKSWQQWFEGIGESIIDAGNPVGPNITVQSNGSQLDNGGTNPATGYGIFKASSQEEAAEIAKNCPILASGGSVEIAEIFDISQSS
jgi:hypothetical protein